MISAAPVGEALSLPLRRSRLGSPERGAGSPDGLTEGFSRSVYGQTPPPHVRSAPFNNRMIAPGNHNFERFAALCNTLPGEARALRACGRLRASPTVGAAKTRGAVGVMPQIYLVYQAFKNFSSKVRKVFAKAPFQVIMGENIFEAGIPYDYCH